MSYRRNLLLALLGLTLSTPLHAADSLVIYSGRSDKFVKPVIEAFKKKTGIDVVLHASKSTELLNRLRLEKDRTSADLFISNDAGNLQLGSKMGLFAPMDPVALKLVPTNYRAGDNTWVGVSARARVLVVNNDFKGKDSLKSVLDLNRPELKGKIGITSSTNESFIAGVSVYMQKLGKEQTRQWLAGLKDQAEGEAFAKHSAIVKAVASGKKQVGLVNHYYIYRHLAKNPRAPISIVLPDQGDKGMGIAWNVAGVAISKYSGKKALAASFVNFLLSTEGQKIFAAVNREYPTVPGVAAASEVPAAGSYKVADVPMTELGTQRNATIDLIEAVGLP